MASASAAISPSFTATDEQLEQRAANAVRLATGWPVDLAIIAEQGTVTLHGRTRSFYEKQLALHAVRRVPGVRRIVDEVEVLPDSTP